MAAKKKVARKNKRGIVFNFYLIVLSVSVFYTVLRQLQYLSGHGINFLNVEGLVIALLSVGALVGLWQWKKWGIYLYLVATFIAIFVPALQSTLAGRGEIDSFDYVSYALATVIIYGFFFLMLSAERRKFA